MRKGIIELKYQQIENVKYFRYLGEIIKFDKPSTGSAENMHCWSKVSIIKKRINFKIPLKTRVLMLNVLSRGRLTYSCQKLETEWNPIEQNNSIYIRMLRKLVTNGSKTEDFRYLTINNDMLDLCKTKDIQSCITKQQTSYLGHLARINLHNDNKKQNLRDWWKH